MNTKIQSVIMLFVVFFVTNLVEAQTSAGKWACTGSLYRNGVGVTLDPKKVFDLDDIKTSIPAVAEYDDSAVFLSHTSQALELNLSVLNGAYYPAVAVASSNSNFLTLKAQGGIPRSGDYSVWIACRAQPETTQPTVAPKSN